MERKAAFREEVAAGKKTYKVTFHLLEELGFGFGFLKPLAIGWSGRSALMWRLVLVSKGCGDSKFCLSRSFGLMHS